MTKTSLAIDGMSCQHCVLSVKKAIDRVKGVGSSDVSVGTATIVYDESMTDRQELENAVRNAGYTIAA